MYFLDLMSYLVEGINKLNIIFNLLVRILGFLNE